MLLAPALLPVADFATLFRIGVLPWAAGAVVASTATLFWLLPPGDWRRLPRRDQLALGALVLLGLAAPSLLGLGDRAWAWPPLAYATFRGVVALLGLFGHPEVDAADYVVGIDGFRAQIGTACSGLEGFALIGALLLGYLWLARRDLRFPVAWILLPVGLVASYVLNVVRIALLLLIGARVSPDLAVTGFHSNAGWLAFALLAFALIGASRLLPVFRRAAAETARPVPPLLQDRNAALILPFVALMLAGVALDTLTAAPALWAPFRGATAALVLVLFAPLLCARCSRQRPSRSRPARWRASPGRQPAPRRVRPAATPSGPSPGSPPPS